MHQPLTNLINHPHPHVIGSLLHTGIEHNVFWWKSLLALLLVLHWIRELIAGFLGSLGCAALGIEPRLGAHKHVWLDLEQ